MATRILHLTPKCASKVHWDLFAHFWRKKVTCGTQKSLLFRNFSWKKISFLLELGSSIHYSTTAAAMKHPFIYLLAFATVSHIFVCIYGWVIHKRAFFEFSQILLIRAEYGVIKGRINFMQLKREIREKISQVRSYKRVASGQFESSLDEADPVSKKCPIWARNGDPSK